ncbi:ATP-binding protein [Aliiglaciecola sp. LCG003]|uniref:ATP-binding protein n=1 Tax=Aliiglaciecola sp. LCG003 TaxID=3053655 RepID=UPI0025734E6A|nr:ATP-binding protein [Aliiglaciecola sp. LCG003]WJG10946.1 ATP-binding protein [Aliiglaciecola sp. LCG003]
MSKGHVLGICVFVTIIAFGAYIANFQNNNEKQKLELSIQAYSDDFIGFMEAQSEALIASQLRLKSRLEMAGLNSSYDWTSDANQHIEGFDSLIHLYLSGKDGQLFQSSDEQYSKIDFYAEVKPALLTFLAQQPALDSSGEIVPLLNQSDNLLFVVPFTDANSNSGYQIMMWNITDWVRDLLSKSTFFKQHFNLELSFGERASYSTIERLGNGQTLPIMSAQAKLTNGIIDVVIQPREQFISLYHSDLPNLILFMSFLMAGLTAFVLGVYIRNTELLLNHKLVSQSLERELVERTNAQRAVEMSSRKIETILNSMQVNIIATDHAGTMTFVNDFAVACLGYSKADILGHNVSKLMLESDAKKHNYNLVNFIQDEFNSIVGKPRDIKVVKNGGSTFDGQISVVEIGTSGEQEFVGAIIDITAQKKLQQLDKLAAQKAEQSNQSKSLFLANMSHEIRTPMNGVMGTLQLLEREQTAEKRDQLVQSAIRSAKKLLTIINDILDFSKIESGQLALESIDFDLNDILEDIKHTLLPAAEAKQIELIFINKEAFDDGWRGDPTRISQILLNIISNAIKFTAVGKVTVEVNAKVLKFGKVCLAISVKDTGIGIDQSTQKHLFTPFSQADETITRQFGGTGLGLSISKQLTEQMGGKIVLDSEPNHGSDFTIYLPLKKCDRSKIKKSSSSNRNIPDLSHLDILVAEDNEINQTIMQSMLEETHANVRFSCDGQQALDEFAKQIPDLILLDIQMPVMDGISACEALRAAKFEGPIIAITANVMKQDIARYKAAGFSQHIAKPFVMGDMLQSLARHGEAVKEKKQNRT